MANKKNRLILSIIGFLIFVIPLFFFCYTVNQEYRFIQNRIQDNLKEKLIRSANELEENLDCYKYLKSEINKIHFELFPKCTEEVLDKIPEDSLTKNLYTKELLNKIVAKTKDKFAPIMITLGTEGFKELYGYYCPNLKKELENNEKSILEAKSFFDMKLIIEKYYYYFKKDYYIDRSSREKAFYFYQLDEHRLKYVDGNDIYSKLCYKYISRFSQYSRTNEPLYTDYFSKQSLFSIVKYTLSKKGIHGFYTLLIPQSQIHPGSMLEYAKSKIDSDVSITIENKKDKLEINQNDNGFEYRFNFSSTFKNHVNLFKKLRGIDKTFILNKQIKLSINYPNEYIIFSKINIATKVLTLLAILFYIVLIFIFKEYFQFKNINLSRKLIYVLSIIILLPILGIGFLNFSLLYNLDELVDISVSKNLHNSLENYALIDNEITTRIFSSIIEMKKKIRQNTLPDFNKYSLIDTFEAKNTKRWNETLTWFNNYNSDLAVISESGNLYLLDNSNGFAYKDSKTEMLIQTLLQKYMNNLSLASSNSQRPQKIFALSLLDQYINHSLEEKSVPQESIYSNDFIFLSKFNNSTYYYAKDNENNNFLLYSQVKGKNDRPYKILHNYALSNPLWYQPNYKYAYDTNLAITHYYNEASKENNRPQFPISSFHNNINSLLDRILDKSERVPK